MPCRTASPLDYGYSLATPQGAEQRRAESESRRLLGGALVVAGLAVATVWLCVRKHDPLIVAALCALFSAAAAVLVWELEKTVLRKR